MKLYAIYRIPDRLDQKRISRQHNNNQNTKSTEQRKSVKVCKGKQSDNIERQTFENNNHLSVKMLKAIRAWMDSLQTLRDHSPVLPTKMTVPKKTSNHNRWSKTFHSRTKFKQYLSTNSGLHKGVEKKTINLQWYPHPRKHKELIISDQQIKRRGEKSIATTTN